ncbi:aquaporin [Streptomyces sp. NBC_01685]|uniref:MIP/aquaporin family protein n=1 Tax=unclassified Streptomyces TaxID=2593676 RepID=UPI002E34A2F4|nr:aquaporin [Streptomyces sp. NBC_01685]
MDKDAARKPGARPRGFVVRTYVTEFVGTFFLVLTVGCAVLSGAPLAALGIGLTLAVMIYAGGHLSGGHFNPAVTVGVLLRGKISAIRALGYCATQIAGGFLAAAVAQFLVDTKAIHTISPSGREVWTVFLAELLFSFALVYVMLNVATSADHPHNGFYGIAIGFTVTAGAVAVGGISGGLFNPAVAFGAATMGIIEWSSMWIWLLAEAAGAILAAGIFLVQNPGDSRETIFTRHLDR